jgi:Flp pilus assembly pilin Flp
MLRAESRALHEEFLDSGRNQALGRFVYGRERGGLVRATASAHPGSPHGICGDRGAHDRRRNLHMSDILLRPIIATQVAVHQLREREDGQTTTEYAILLGFLAIAIIIALFFLKNVLKSLFSSAASSVSNAPSS